MDLTAKAAEINLLLCEPDVDLWRLRELALTEGGLVNDTLRKRAWPKLVGLHGDNKEDKTSSRRNRNRIPRPGMPPSVPPPGAPPRPPIISRQQDDDSTVGSVPESPSKLERKRAAECLDADQIDRDVARCTWHLLTGSQRSRRLQMRNKHRKKVANLLKKKQRRLGNFINLTLVQTYADSSDNDQLRYYQGYHDVACIFLSALGGGGSGPMPVAANSDSWEGVAASMGLDLPSRVLGQVSKSHFRDAMRSTFMQLQVALRLILFPLIGALDPEVHDHLYFCEMEPFFALSWVITWFSHDVRDTEMVKRLFDAFLVSHPLMPMYMSVAMILHPVNRAEVLQTDCDFASVHQALAGLPKNSSMVGWRFRVHDGYVSGDEDDDLTVLTDLDTSIVSDDIAMLEGRLDDESESQSVISGGLAHLGDGSRVPFQELIDMALSFMRRIPPRKLLGLAKRYFAEESIHPLLEHASSISLLQPPPSWGLASTTPADWVLKQRARESCGMKATNRRDRRIPTKSRSRSRTRGETADASDEKRAEELESRKYLAEQRKSLAVIASGFGPGDDDDERRRRRYTLLMYSCVVIALVAISYALVMQPSPHVAAQAIESDSKPDVSRDTRASESVQRETLKTKEVVSEIVSIKQSTATVESTVKPTTSHANQSAEIKSTKTRPPMVGTSKQQAVTISPTGTISTPQSIVIKESIQQTKAVGKAAVLSSVSTKRLSDELKVVVPKTNTDNPQPAPLLHVIQRRAMKILGGQLMEGLIHNVHNFFKQAIPGAELAKGRISVQEDKHHHGFPGSKAIQGFFFNAYRAIKQRNATLMPGVQLFHDVALNTRDALKADDAEIMAL